MNHSQGRRLIAELKRRPMTSMELLMLGISTCWWKRVSETLQEDERLDVVGTRRVDGKRVCLYRVTKKVEP